MPIGYGTVCSGAHAVFATWLGIELLLSGYRCFGFSEPTFYKSQNTIYFVGLLRLFHTSYAGTTYFVSICLALVLMNTDFIGRHAVGLCWIQSVPNSINWYYFSYSPFSYFLGPLGSFCSRSSSSSTPLLRFSSC